MKTHRSVMTALVCLSCSQAFSQAESFTFQPIVGTQVNPLVAVGQVNNAGEAVVTTFNFEGLSPTLYTPATGLTILPSYPNYCAEVQGCFSAGAAINNKGQVIGTSNGPLTPNGSSPYYQSAYIYSNNAWTEINGPASTPSPVPQRDVVFKGLNQSGQVVATYGHFFYYHNDPTNIQPVFDGSFLWANGTPRKIIDPSAAAANLTFVSGINDTGEIVGSYQDRLNSSHGFIDVAGAFRNLDFPGAKSTQLALVNDRSQIVGTYIDNAGASHEFFFSNGKFYTITAPGSGATTITALNNEGEIVGYSPNGGFIYDNGSYQTLNYPGGPTMLESVNDNGVILGYDSAPDGALQNAFLAYPESTSTPEPASLALFLIAAFAIPIVRISCKKLLR